MGDLRAGDAGASPWARLRAECVRFRCRRWEGRTGVSKNWRSVVR